MYTGNYDVREDATLVLAEMLKFLQSRNEDAKLWLKRISESDYGFAEIDELTDFNQLVIDALNFSDAEITDASYNHMQAVMSDVCVLCAQELTK
jgi:hypothetical protein